MDGWMDVQEGYLSKHIFCFYKTFKTMMGGDTHPTEDLHDLKELNTIPSVLFNCSFFESRFNFSTPVAFQKLRRRAAIQPTHAFQNLK